MTNFNTQWRAVPTAGHEIHGQSVISSLVNGETIAIVYDGERYADFIATACNAHHELLEALELCYDHCRLYHPEVEDNNVGASVRAALNKAKEAP